MGVNGFCIEKEQISGGSEAQRKACSPYNVGQLGRDLHCYRFFTFHGRQTEARLRR